VLHGEQTFELHSSLPLGATVDATHRVSAVADKGPGRGAVLYFETEIRDAARGTPLATLRAANFLRGDGGCGNFGDAPSPLPALSTEEPPDHCVHYPTQGQAALLYRLASRDYMPTTPTRSLLNRQVSSAPISHGLNTFGLACRAILKCILPTEVHRMRTMAVRFVAPAFPGDTIRIELFKRREGVSFRAWAVERQTLVLDRGHCTLSER